MKKSYHSKIVPAELAAMTSRISFALGSYSAGIAPLAIIVPLSVGEQD